MGKQPSKVLKEEKGYNKFLQVINRNLKLDSKYKTTLKSDNVNKKSSSHLIKKNSIIKIRTNFFKEYFADQENITTLTQTLISNIITFINKQFIDLNYYDSICSLPHGHFFVNEKKTQALMIENLLNTERFFIGCIENDTLILLRNFKKYTERDQNELTNYILPKNKFDEIYKEKDDNYSLQNSIPSFFENLERGDSKHSNTKEVEVDTKLKLLPSKSKRDIIKINLNSAQTIENDDYTNLAGQKNSIHKNFNIIKKKVSMKLTTNINNINTIRKSTGNVQKSILNSNSFRKSSQQKFLNQKTNFTSYDHLIKIDITQSETNENEDMRETIINHQTKPWNRPSLTNIKTNAFKSSLSNVNKANRKIGNVQILVNGNRIGRSHYDNREDYKCPPFPKLNISFVESKKLNEFSNDLFYSEQLEKLKLNNRQLFCITDEEKYYYSKMRSPLHIPSEYKM